MFVLECAKKWEALQHCTATKGSTVLTRYYAPNLLPMRFSYKYGGLIIEQWKLVPFIRPLTLVVNLRGKQQWQICPSPSRVACNEACSGSVLQGKGSLNEGAECQGSENTNLSHHHQVNTSLPLHGESLGRCITGQQVARLLIQGGTMSSNLFLVHRSRRGRGGHKLEINIPQQQIHENSKEGLINEGVVMSSEYGMHIIGYEVLNYVMLKGPVALTQNVQCCTKVNVVGMDSVRLAGNSFCVRSNKD